MTIDEIIAYATHTSYNINPAVLSGMLETLKKGGGGGDTVADSIVDRTITSFSSDTITSIGNYAFNGCSALTTVNFPEVTSIGTRAFYGCSALTTADFPKATSIGDSMFYDCVRLTTVDFPEVTSIGSNAFRSCTTLTTVILRKNQVATLGSNAFLSAPNAIIYVPDGLVTSYQSATNWSSLASRIKGISELPTA